MEALKNIWKTHNDIYISILLFLLFAPVVTIAIRSYLENKPLTPIQRFNKMFGKTFTGMKVKFNFNEQTNTLIIIDRGLFKFDPENNNQNACFNVILSRIRKANINVQELLA
jgi:hypothetical protein